MAAGRLGRAGAERGTALITALIMLTVLGLFLFGFETINKNELLFAGYSRNSTLELNVAEAGVQEAIHRLNTTGAVPGVTCFVNSMTPGATCSGSTSSVNANTVAYQAPFSGNPDVFPILSVASTNGATRAVRILEQALFKTGFSTVIFGPQLTFQGDTSPTIGDTYSQSSLKFQTYAKSPQPATGATATNLLTPQVMAGSWIDTTGSGPGHFTSECTSGSTSEVAPTNCARGANPVNWHPATPVGMTAADFNAVMNAWNAGSLPAGVTVAQATQSGTNVTYSPLSFTPSYWSSIPATNGKVYVVASSSVGFCVNASNGQVRATGGCTGSWNTYGSTTDTVRYVDWGLVSDDLNRATATKFYQPSTCTTCNGGGPNGYQNGIRYIPILPTISVMNFACSVNMPSPGFSAFYNTTADGVSCANPPTQTGSGTFTGTKASPEYLVIDDGAPGGTQVTLSSSGTAPSGCADSFANANWGVILATGDLNLQNFTFNGFIYANGNVYSHGHVLVRGGIFSSNGSHDQIDTLGTLQFCGGASVVPLAPQFYTFTTLTWQDRPAGQP